MTTPSYPIQGIPDGVHPRKELSAWSTDADETSKIQVSLFIQAMAEFQKVNPVTDQLSYYRVAG